MDFLSPEDFALAVKLQQQFDSGDPPPPASSVYDDCVIDNEATDQKTGDTNDWGASSSDWSNSYNTHKSKHSSKSHDTSSWSLVDPRWEDIDPLPDIRALFIEFNDKYFWSKLAGIEVRWSPRMTLCAGLCVYEGHGGLCSVRLSEPLLKLRPRKDLIETLLHEMIHAYLFVTDNNKDHDGHGPEFHKHMYRLNEKTGTNITVYHTFHDEVANYRQHWWKCDGPCQKKPPYYGMVKRAMNRPPSARDPWWADHQRTCGGTYTKVKEPDGYKDKKAKKLEKEEKKVADKQKGKNGNMDIRIFGSKGKSLGGAANSSGSEKIPDIQQSSGSNNLPQTNSSGSVGSGSNNSGVGANVHGFNGKDAKSNKTNNLHANIHGFGKLTNDSQDISDDDQDTQVGIKPTPKSFPGHGSSLGTKAGSGSSSGGPIIRKIPGIGIITSEHIGSLDSGPVDDVDETPKAQHNGAAAPASFNNVSNYISSDSDFDDILDDLLKPPEKKVKKQDKPTVKRSGSFTSVANKHRHSDPDRWKKADKLPDPRSRLSGEQAGGSGSRLPLKRKVSTNDSLAADRNKRAFCLSSSDEDSDFDEGATLGSVFRNKNITAEGHTHHNFKKTSNSSRRDCDDLSERNSSHGANNVPSEMPPSPSSHSGRDFETTPHQPSLATGSSVLRDCPVCNTKVPEANINEHLDQCLLNMQ